MNFIPLISTTRIAQLLKLTSLAGMLLILNSCGIYGESHSADFSAPMMAPSVSSSYVNSAPKSLNRNSVSTQKRQLVKKGSLNIKADKVRKSAETIESIVLQNGGQFASMDERDDNSKYANYEAYVPAANLVSTMDQISQLGKVTYRKISAEDVTKDIIRFKTKLQNLKKRRSRILALYQSTKSVEDKLELEEKLSELESEIYEMEESMRQMQKISHFSKLSLSVSQSTIRGPLGVVKDSGSWLVSKLFTIRK